MLRGTALALAASLLIAAPGARAAVQGITDGTSNTILLPERQLGTQVELAGTGKVRAGEIARRGPFPTVLVFDADGGTFSLLVDGELFLTGHLVAKGTKGNRFKLFLDPPSRDLFANEIAGLAQTTSVSAPGAVLGETMKLELSLDAAGTARLKVKCNVLTSGIGEVVFKASLSGAL